MSCEEKNASGKEYSALGLGEVMLRLSPPGDERIAKGNQFQKNAGGSELNVLSGISRLGLRTGLISRTPANLVGRYIRSQIRSYSVSDDYVLDDPDENARLGVYYYESGAYPRKPQVVYDRNASSFTKISTAHMPNCIYESTKLFHTSGVTLALCKNTCDVAVEMIKKFREAGAKISFDVNYRAKLWGEEKARETIYKLLPFIDILFVSEETSRRMMQRTGTLEEIQKGYHADFGISIVASTQRSINSPRSHNFTSQLYSAQTGEFYSAKPYENIEVVDRIGSGDAYVSGVLYGFLSGKTHEEALQYGNAMSAVKNTIPGDLTNTDIGEIESIIKDHASGAPSGEMNR